MVETVEDVTGASVPPPVNRIFVGGLGANVTADDIANIFASLGRVRGVEFVRTNGRNFAYMDFEPQSDKALAKLFSSYNGCKWKGGKLRLEKAKEHYLSRLRREWEADAVPSTPVTQDVEINKEETKSRNVNLDSMKISIFFPRLKKIKVLPYKGSGKHKYSFQRVEVSSTLPLHFCDCEEHCGPPDSANQTYVSALESAAHEKELSIMQSVMKKLLKEKDEKQEELAANTDVVEPVQNSVEEQREDEGLEEVTEEVSEEESDEDLVINISSRRSDKSLLNFKVSDPISSMQESKERKHQQSTKNIPKRNVKEHAEIALEPTQDDKNPLPITTDKTTLDEFSSLLSRNNTSSVENQNQPTDQKSTEKSGKSSGTWFQKSAWRDLVGDTTSNLFSLSSSTQPSISSIISNSQPVSENNVDSTTTSRKRKQISSVEPVLTPTEAKISEEEKNEQHKQEYRRVVKKVTVGEVCPFMRSAESEKEWNQAKKALAGYMKKKSTESSSGSGLRKGSPFRGKRVA